MKLFNYLTNLHAPNLKPVCIIAKDKKEAIKIAHAISPDVRIIERKAPVNVNYPSYYQRQIELGKEYIKNEKLIIKENNNEIQTND